MGDGMLRTRFHSISITRGKDEHIYMYTFKPIVGHAFDELTRCVTEQVSRLNLFSQLS